MKIKLDKTDSKVVHSNEIYDVLDNTNLNNLIVSKTILHAGKKTGGHNHSGQEEVYIFMEGEGTMIVGTNTFEVKAGDTILISLGSSTTYSFSDLVDNRGVFTVRLTATSRGVTKVLDLRLV